MRPSLHDHILSLHRRLQRVEQYQREVSTPAPCTTVRGIIQAAAREFDVPVAGILSTRRCAELVVPRQIAMALSVEMLNASLPRVGRAFGRDHTTVLHALRRVGERRAVDPDYAARIARVRLALTTTTKGAAA